MGNATSQDVARVYAVSPNTPRGIALIINVHNTAGRAAREGSKVDVTRIETLFKNLRYDVRLVGDRGVHPRVVDDPTAAQIIAAFEQAATDIAAAGRRSTTRSCASSERTVARARCLRRTTSPCN